MDGGTGTTTFSVTCCAPSSNAAIRGRWQRCVDALRHGVAIAVCVSDRPIDWDGAGVRLVLLVAFNADDRRTFREVFDQIVVALSEPARVRKLVTAAQDYEAFIADLMDALDV